MSSLCYFINVIDRTAAYSDLFAPKTQQLLPCDITLDVYPVNKLTSASLRREQRYSSTKEITQPHIVFQNIEN